MLLRKVHFGKVWRIQHSIGSCCGQLDERLLKVLLEEVTKISESIFRRYIVIVLIARLVNPLSVLNGNLGDIWRKEQQRKSVFTTFTVVQL